MEAIGPPGKGSWASVVLQLPCAPGNVLTHPRPIVEQNVLPFIDFPTCSLYQPILLYTIIILMFVFKTGSPYVALAVPELSL